MTHPKPMKFTPEMEEAIRKRRKTQTRRPIKRAALGRIQPHSYSIGEIVPIDGTDLLIKIEAIRFERLRDISYEDILAEGIIPEEDTILTFFFAFEELWDSIYGDGAYDENTVVWVYTFSLVKGSSDAYLKPM